MKKLPFPLSKPQQAALAAAMVLGGWGAAPDRSTPDLSAIQAARIAAARQLRQTAPPAVPHAAAASTIMTFDAPGAGTGAGQGTSAIAINSAGAVAGGYIDANGLAHGFLLLPYGSFTTFDAPGAVNGTYPAGMDDAGTITGTYYDANYNGFGFSRAANGTFVQLAAPGGVPLIPSGISPSGAITGSYADIGGLSHGFRLSAKGRFTAFEAAGAGILPGQGTDSKAIGSGGQVAGIYIDPDGHNHAYVGAKNGGFATLTPPGSLVTNDEYEYAFLFVPGLAINAHGAVAGNYFQSIQGSPFGGDVNVYIQSANGAPTIFGIGDTGPCCIFTYVTGLNAGGTAIGYDNDYYNLNHGFVRAPNGTITVFDAPGAGTGFYQGTLPAAINKYGAIAGVYQDQSYVFHGFVRAP